MDVGGRGEEGKAEWSGTYPALVPVLAHGVFQIGNHLKVTNRF